MNGRRNNSRITRQSGSSLFEVLMAIVVLSGGVLGLVRLQATGLVNNQNAYQISQATVLAYDLADRMRSNTESMDNYLTSYMTLDAAYAADEQAGCKSTSGCSSDEMAQDDLRDWYLAIQAALPSATGTITNGGTDVYTITVNWDGNRDGTVNDSDLNLQVSFQP